MTSGVYAMQSEITGRRVGLTAARLGSAALLAVTALGAIACGDGPRVPVGTSQTTVRDSAGIEIVENTAPAYSGVEAWTVAPEPTVRIGADYDDPDQALFRVRGAAMLPDGRIVIAQGGEPLIRWYAADGSFHQGAGRLGEGPGEFGTPFISLINLPGDSLGVVQPLTGQIYVLDDRGAMTRELALQPSEDLMRSSAAVSALGDGFVRTHPRGTIYADQTDGTFVAPPGTVRVDSLIHALYAPDGSFDRVYGVFPAAERVVREFFVGQRVTQEWSMLPFGSVAVSATRGDHIYLGSGERYEIVIRDLYGTPIRSIRRTDALRPVTAELIEAYSSTRVGDPDDPARAEYNAYSRRFFESAPYPDSVAPYQELHVARDGTMWVRAYDAGDADALTWSVFSPEGSWLSDVVLPRDWEVLDVGPDRVLVLTRDALDVELIQVFEVGSG